MGLSNLKKKPSGCFIAETIHKPYASQIERGISNPSLRVICALAEVLKVEPTDLLKLKNKH